MIQCKLWAQLGNQCFMLAAAIAHAKKMGTTWGAPNRTLDPRIWPIYFRTLPPAKKTTLHYYKEPRHAHDPLPEVDDLTIEGYFQSEEYFRGVKQEIAKALGFPYAPLDTVAVHVRRGDYLLYPDQFPVLPDDYYKAAVRQMLALNFNNFKVYSDDIPYCRKMFERITDPEWIKWGFRVEYSTNKDPLSDMREIFNSKAIITANSTFSLFPALLRPATMPCVIGLENFIVIAPAEHLWYGPKNAHLETCDLLPERFIKI